MAPTTTSRDEIKRAIIRHSKAVKRKFLALQRGRLTSQHILSEAFQPITSPLHTLVNQNRNGNVSSTAKVENVKADNIKHEVKITRGMIDEEYGPIAAPFIFPLVRQGRTRVYDKLYGIQYKPTSGEFILGESPVYIRNDLITVSGVNYRGTRGIYNLLFMANPPPDSYDTDDLHKYKDMLLATNAHRYNCDPREELRHSNTKKFQEIILPLFEKRGGSWKTSLPDHKMEYKYWDNPNELVERLHLLMSSRYAGNSGLYNEIYAIEEELREGGYIE